MNRLCINCPGILKGDCFDCDADEDPRGGDYDEDEFEDENDEEVDDGND